MDGIYGDFDMIWTGTFAYSPILRKLIEMKWQTSAFWKEVRLGNHINSKIYKNLLIWLSKEGKIPKKSLKNVFRKTLIPKKVKLTIQSNYASILQQSWAIILEKLVEKGLKL